MTQNFLGLAISIAAQAHEKVCDRGGKPYILHPIRVMMRLRTHDEELMQIAILHDVLEDCPEWTLPRLGTLGFSSRVLAALTCLTHDHAIAYDQYVRVIGTNADATRVKLEDLRDNLEDLRDNLDPTRLKGITENDNLRTEKYHKAFTYLTKQQALRADVGY